MDKIPTIFLRDEKDRSKITDVGTQECDWVFEGEGVATQKLDGTCVLIKDGKYYKRHTVKKNKQEPNGFYLCDHDNITDKKIGWVLVDPDHPANKYHMEAFRSYVALENGTYELIGPKFQGNPENAKEHHLIKHTKTKKYDSVPRTFTGIRGFMVGMDIEGIIFQHPDGRMGKIKKKDYGLKRK